MATVPRPKALLLTALSAVLLFGGCERRVTEAPDMRPQKDARVAKNFGSSEPEFCSFTLVSPGTASEGETTAPDPVETRIVFTASDKATTQAALEATCKAIVAADPKAAEACDAYVKNPDLYSCVAPSIFSAAPATTGAWICTLDYTANDIDEKIPKKGATATAASQAVFTECAAETDGETSTETKIPEKTAPAKTVADLAYESDGIPSAETAPSPTPSGSPVPTIYVQPSKRRDACAAALIAKKMVCENSNTYPATTAKPLPTRRLYR
jgi:hypothetical protein